MTRSRSESVYETPIIFNSEQRAQNGLELVSETETELLKEKESVGRDWRTVGIRFPKLFVYSDLGQFASERQGFSWLRVGTLQPNCINSKSSSAIHHLCELEELIKCLGSLASPIVTWK